ncbi:Putative ribonuclease H protein At1g65750 [Linum grandiflorum]
MSLFLLPKLIIKRMDTLLRNFFWAGSTTKRTIHWCKGSKLCAPKSEGGLGFREFGLFNKALLAKQGWRLLNSPDALWARVLKGLYFRNDSFLSAKKGGRCSWIWASLCDARESLHLGLIKVIGNGEATLISDPWVPSLPDYCLHVNEDDNRKVCDLLLPNRDGWNWQAIHDEFSTAEGEAIRRVPLGPNDLADHWAWKHDKLGRFSVRSAYHATRDFMNFDGTPLNLDDRAVWKWLWSLSMPRKINFFLWRMANKALATKVNLFRRNCADSAKCPLCDQVESTHHCLFYCHHAMLSWFSFPDLHPPNEDTSIFDWLSMLRLTGNRDKAIMAASLCWNVWKTRNAAVFKSQRPVAANTASRSSKEAIEWRIAWTTTPRCLANPPLNTHHVMLTPPSNPQRVIHCDGSFLHDSQTAAYGFTVSNVHGTVYDGKVGQAFVTSPVAAEAVAIFEAIEYAKHHEGQSTIFSDCLVLVDILKDGAKPWPWDCSSTIAHIRRALLIHLQIKIRFTPRSSNGRADWAVKSFIHGTLPTDWVHRCNFIPVLL